MTWGVISLLLAVTAGHCMEHVCPQGGCGNITVNLGARWGTKITVFQNEDGSIDVKMTPSNDTSTSCISSADNYTRGDDHPRAATVAPRHYNVIHTQLHKRDPLGFKTQVLDLSGNNYTGDDVKMALKQVNASDLRRVTVLYLGHNNITSLPAFTFPETMEGCPDCQYSPRLVELHLDHNRLVFSWETRFELRRLEGLRVLNLSWSEFSRWNDLELLFLPFLQHLDLSYNQLTNFPVIPGLTGLRTLDLTGNYLTSPYMSTSLITNQDQLPSSLDTLLLAHNGMTSLNGLKKSLFKVDVSNNSFSRIWDIDWIDVRYLQVGDNPWMCDCRLVKFISDKGSIIQDKQQFRCSLNDVEYNPFVDLPTMFQVKCYFHQAESYVYSTWWFKGGERVGYMLSKCYPTIERLVSLLGWVFAVVAAVLVWGHRRQTQQEKTAENKNSENSGNEVPYNKLDDEQTV